MTMATTNQCEYDDTDNNGTNESRTNLQELLSRLSLILAGSSSVHNNNNNKNNNNNDNPETAAEEKNTNNERDAILTQLFEGFDPETIFDTISPLLFSNSHTNNTTNTTNNNNNNNNANNNVEKDTISSEKQLCTCTLQSLIAIVSTQPARFTLPAITSIYNHVKKQQSNMMRIDYDENNIDSFNCNINISNELIDTIFHLVQHQSLQIANVASQTLILLASKVLLPSPSPYQRHVTSKIILLIHDYIQHLVFAMSNPRTACSSDVKNKDHKKTGGLVIGSNNSDNHREHERNTSILVIRNLTLLVDIVKTATTLTTTANAYSFLLLSTHYTNTSTTSSAATTNTRTVTILDPILNLFTLMQHDPLFIINMFEILEQMVSTTHATTTTTTTTTTKTTTSTKKMFSAWIQENLIAMLLSKVGFMLKKKNEDELGEYGFVLKCINDIDLFCYNSALSILSSSCCCTSGTSISTSNSSDDDGMKLTPSMMILIFKYILSSCINESHDEVEMIQFINSLTTFTIEDDCRSNDNRPNSSNFSTSSSSSISNERNERLNLVLKETDLIEFWFSMKRGSSKFKAATLCSIAAVIECKDCSSNSINNDSDGIEIMNTFVSNEMCMDMYTLIGEVNGNSTTTALLINYMKSAIIEIRLATYAIIKAMIVNRKSNRGIFLLISHGGFMELILSRNIEDVKESNELKYEIVKGILDSDVKALLNQPVVQLLERHVNQGPHYLQGVRGDMLVE